MNCHRIALGLLFAGAVVAGAQAAEAGTRCRIEFNLKSKAVFYKKGNGSGTVTCDNGQSAKVKIISRGGGLTFGKDEVIGGTGVFSAVDDIGEVFGAYAEAEASAGAQKSAASRAMWKGDVSLALAGTGEGINVGFSFGKFKITRE
jgi:hypothetical protein